VKLVPASPGLLWAHPGRWRRFVHFSAEAHTMREAVCCHLGRIAIFPSTNDAPAPFPALLIMNLFRGDGSAPPKRTVCAGGRPSSWRNAGITIVTYGQTFVSSLAKSTTNCRCGSRAVGSGFASRRVKYAFERATSIMARASFLCHRL